MKFVLLPKLAPAARSEIVVASFLAPNLEPFYAFVAERLGAAAGRPVRFVVGESLDDLRNGSIDFAFLCGLPLVRFRREPVPAVTAVAAPVIKGRRYGGRAVYFSDVIVRHNSPFRTFADLRGASWAYNEPDSHSGYLVTLHHLLRLGETAAFFGHTEMLGFHQESIRRVAAGGIDASAVDSQVLAVELRDHPQLRARLRIVESFGPSPIQPLVATAAVPEDLRRVAREAMLRLGATAPERAELDRGLVERFVAASDADYNPIAVMLDAVEERHLALA